MGKGWSYLQEWIDRQPYKVHDRQLAEALGFSQNNFPGWKDPKRLPSREALTAIAKLTGHSFFEVRDAFLADIGYDSPASDEELRQAQAERKERAAGRRRPMEGDDQ